MALTKEQQEYMENLLKPGEDPGEGYEGSPDMYPDYEEDKKDLKKGRKPKHMGSMMGGSVNKYKSGSYVTVKTKLGRNKKTKIC